MLIVFAIIPFFYNIYLSFHEFVPLKRKLVYTGFDNWIILFNDPIFWNSFKVTLYYTSVCLFIELILGMSIALLIDSDKPGYGVIRSLLTLTLVIPPAIAGMIFLILEDAHYGLISWGLKSIGLLGAEQTILADSILAFWGVVIVDVWQWTPFMVLIFIAGLLSGSWWAVAIPVALLLSFVLGLVFWVGWTIMTVDVQTEDVEAPDQIDSQSEDPLDPKE